MGPKKGKQVGAYPEIPLRLQTGPFWHQPGRPGSPFVCERKRLSRTPCAAGAIRYLPGFCVAAIPTFPQNLNIFRFSCPCLPLTCARGYRSKQIHKRLGRNMAAHLSSIICHRLCLCFVWVVLPKCLSHLWATVGFYLGFLYGKRSVCMWLALVSAWGLVCVCVLLLLLLLLPCPTPCPPGPPHRPHCPLGGWGWLEHSGFGSVVLVTLSGC